MDAWPCKLLSQIHNFPEYTSTANEKFVNKANTTAKACNFKVMAKDMNNSQNRGANENENILIGYLFQYHNYTDCNLFLQKIHSTKN